MVELLTPTGQKIKLDKEDYYRIVKFVAEFSPNANPDKWQVTFNTTDKKRKYYATKLIGGRQPRGRHWKMHRLIMHLRGVSIEGMEIDHEDGDGLNNTFTNIRISNSSQNKGNQARRSDSKNPYKGVQYQKQNRNWCAYICPNGKKTHLGVFATPEEAALRYNEAAIEKWGPFAKLNQVALKDLPKEYKAAYTKTVG